MDGRFGPHPHHVERLWYWGPGIFAGLFTLILLAVLVGLLVWLIVSVRRSGGAGMGGGGRMLSEPPRAGDGALELARMRYARGEISREEFQALVQDLARGPTAG